MKRVVFEDYSTIALLLAHNEQARCIHGSLYLPSKLAPIHVSNKTKSFVGNRIVVKGMQDPKGDRLVGKNARVELHETAVNVNGTRCLATFSFEWTCHTKCNEGGSGTAMEGRAAIPL